MTQRNGSGREYVSAEEWMIEIRNRPEELAHELSLMTWRGDWKVGNSGLLWCGDGATYRLSPENRHLKG